MKHAYLIIAHNEFEVLELLISSLDNEKNDIYVHFDQKIKKVPNLNAKKSILYILEKRIDVRWGNYSQIQCEYLLWETASANGPYDFYHMISGVHLPLLAAKELYSYFARFHGKSLFCNLQKRNGDYQEILKIHRINICTRTYASSNSMVSVLSQFVWKLFVALQRCLKFTVNDGIQFYWANNWCSLSQSAIDYLIGQKDIVLKRYRWSFCGDEWFAPTELMNSELQNDIINLPYLFNTIGKNNASVLDVADIAAIESGNYCFARKFSSKHVDMINFVLCKIKEN